MQQPLFCALRWCGFVLVECPIRIGRTAGLCVAVTRCGSITPRIGGELSASRPNPAGEPFVADENKPDSVLLNCFDSRLGMTGAVVIMPRSRFARLLLQPFDKIVPIEFLYFLSDVEPGFGHKTKNRHCRVCGSCSSLTHCNRNHNGGQ